nr:hypothetical protein [Tanacetum cinerariifolium]
MHKAFPLPVMEFPLTEEVPTASEESSHCQKKRDHTAVKIRTATKVKNLQRQHSEMVAKFEAQELEINRLKARVKLLEDREGMAIERSRDDAPITGRNLDEGEAAAKRTKKNLLKQQYGNFKAEGSKTLEQTFNRLSGNEKINIASVSTTSTNVSTVSVNIGVASISQDTACAYIASQSSGSQIKFEDINQIDKDDMEEMDIKWNMALLSMRADRFWKKTGKKISIQGTDVAGFDKSKNHALIADEEPPTEFALMAKTSAKSKVFDSSLCFKACKKNTDSLNSKITDLTDKLVDAKNMIYYKLRLAQVKARIAEHRSQELKYYEKIRVLVFKTESRANCIENLTKDLDLLKKEKDELETKLTGFQTASKDLDSLLESQRLDKNKEGLGYSDVPPPPAQIYSPPKKDMSWTGLLEFKDDTVTDYSRPSLENQQRILMLEKIKGIRTI